MKLKTILATILLTSLTACSYLPAKYRIIHNHSDDYQKATYTKPLSLPQGYSSNKFKDYYVVPNPQLAKQDYKKVDVIPPDLNKHKIPKPVHFWDRYPWFGADSKVVTNPGHY